jgi:hypothetical protein
MTIILATGGLDEMAIDVSYAIFFGIFVILTALIVFSWWKRSLATGIVASIFVLVDGFLIEPWEFIISRPSDGPYDQDWQLKMRIISALWFISVLLTVACLARAIHHRKAKAVV